MGVIIFFLQKKISDPLQINFDLFQDKSIKKNIMEKYIYGLLVLSGLINLYCIISLVMVWRHVKYMKKELFAAMGSHLDTLKEFDKKMKEHKIVNNGEKR